MTKKRKPTVRSLQMELKRVNEGWSRNCETWDRKLAERDEEIKRLKTYRESNERASCNEAMKALTGATESLSHALNNLYGPRGRYASER